MDGSSPEYIDRPMDCLSSESDIWEAIELSESYMICCMFKEAASLASSILKHLLCKSLDGGLQATVIADMRESAGMVLVQSLKESSRTKEIFAELQDLFGSIDGIPGQVFVAGACMQLSEGLTSSLRPILEQFLGAWKFVNGHVDYAVISNEKLSSKTGNRHLSMDLESYMDVIDIYVMQLLGVTLQKVDLAVSWTKNADIPEEKRQDLLMRLHSLNILSPAVRIPKQSPSNDISATKLTSKMEGIVVADKIQIDTSENRSKFSLIKAIQALLCRFSPVDVDIAYTCFVPRLAKLTMWGSLAAFLCYILQRKHMTLKRLAVRLYHSIRRVIIDTWRLAFTVHVNPLAAVQPLTSGPQGSR